MISRAKGLRLREILSRRVDRNWLGSLRRSTDYENWEQKSWEQGRDRKAQKFHPFNLQITMISRNDSVT